MTKKKEQDEPTREEVIAWYNDEIELATLRRDLAVLQAEAVKAESERYQHAMMIGQIKAAQEEMEKEEGQAPMMAMQEEG